MKLIELLLIITLTCSNAFRIVNLKRHSCSKLLMGVGKEAKRSWTTGDLAGKDMFEEEDSSDMKKKFKLEPEVVFYEGPPSSSEVLFPALSIFTVIGIIPFISALARQAWVRYKVTSRRISIQSGIGGNDQSEIIYPDVEQIKYVYRAFGSSGDMVLFLKDGAKVELRHVPKFDEIYTFIMGKCDEECQAKSMKLKTASG